MTGYGISPLFVRAALDCTGIGVDLWSAASYLAAIATLVLM